jgi:hypothetical protein
MGKRLRDGKVVVGRKGFTYEVLRIAGRYYIRRTVRVDRAIQQEVAELTNAESAACRSLFSEVEIDWPADDEQTPVDVGVADIVPGAGAAPRERDDDGDPDKSDGVPLRQEWDATTDVQSPAGAKRKRGRVSG